ncbi:MAG: MauE/DoxX family redox-associated membrane protein [Spirosomataceae bacterium]
MNKLSLLKYLIALLYLYAGVYKVSDVTLFKSQLIESPLLPEKLISFIAVALPIFEIGLGLSLIFLKKAKTALWLSLSLMLFFTLYLSALYFLYEKPPCACGGILSNMDYPEHIVFNILYTIICILAIYFYEKTDS